jgi:hypothetical protein
VLDQDEGKRPKWRGEEDLLYLSMRFPRWCKRERRERVVELGAWRCAWLLGAACLSLVCSDVEGEVREGARESEGVMVSMAMFLFPTFFRNLAYTPKCVLEQNCWQDVVSEGDPIVGEFLECLKEKGGEDLVEGICKET